MLYVIVPAMVLGKAMADVEVVLFVSAVQPVQDNRFSSEHAGTRHHQAIIYLSTIEHRCDCLGRRFTEVSCSDVHRALLQHSGG
jgi:hypothetical protein